MRKSLKIIHRFLILLGVDLFKTKDFVFNIFWFFKCLIQFKSLNNSTKFKLKIFPILGENRMSAGTINSHYFIQDLFVAQQIFQQTPNKILDVGSRIDGFVSNVASFREIDIVDIRPLENITSNINFKQIDLTNDISSIKGEYDCITCLHAIEHFGLGRYGDTIDPDGHLKGIENIYLILEKKGTCYLSFPLGDNRIEFNAHRVFSLEYIVPVLKKYFTIKTFNYISEFGILYQNQSINIGMQNNFDCKYGCAIFILTKE